MAFAEDRLTLRDGAFAKVGTSADDDAGGLATGVGIDDLDLLHEPTWSEIPWPSPPE